MHSFIHGFADFCRSLGGFRLAIASAVALGLAGVVIYSTGFGLFFPIEQRGGIYLASILIVICKFGTDRLKTSGGGFSNIANVTVDILLLAAAVFSIYRFMIVQTAMANDLYDIVPADILACFVGLIVIVELTRRVWGWTLFVVSLLSLIYILWGQDLPGVLRHSGFSYEQLAENLWFNLNKGIFGSITNIVINVVLIFVLFGVMLESTGAGQTLLKYAFRLTQKTRGGPAHAAIIASGLFGTMSGSPVANIVGTGTFTIPIIKKRGFSPEFSAGVEATASCGGQIMPPIMGAAALVMADLAGIPYLFLITAALIPALFYYLSLFLGVTVEARKQGIEPITDLEAYKITPQDRLNAIMFVAPILSVIIGLVMGFSPAMAGFFALVVLLLCSIVNPEVRKNPARLLRGLISGGVNAAELMISVAAIEIVVGVMDTTGLGLKFAGMVENIGNQQLFLSLFVAMTGALILGMGMPTLPAYLIIVLIMGPAIKLLGLSTLVVHLFVFYYGVASSLTPPVAIAAYVAAPIAGANPIMTALMALRIGAAKFIIPFAFAYYPTLLLVENFDIIAFFSILVRLSLTVYLVSSALSAFDRTKLNFTSILIRLVLAVLCLLTPIEYHGPATVFSVMILLKSWQIFPFKTRLSS
ncbi:MAG TPA: TRAP transporter fused permease subunit [Rhodospirillales bacterium]|jgi:TRAP transporter 4TM/12TM fusion protein|nr:TRAP transporter fused permease subunit [Rhodospirillales bacterium]